MNKTLNFLLLIDFIVIFKNISFEVVFMEVLGSLILSIALISNLLIKDGTINKEKNIYIFHLTFIILSLLLLLDNIYLIYHILFYFGFINTIIFILVSISIFSTNIINNNKINNIGIKAFEYLKLIINSPITYYIYIYVKSIIIKIINKFLEINNNLSKNQYSKILIEKIYTYINKIKMYFTNLVINPEKILNNLETLKQNNILNDAINDLDNLDNLD